MKTWPPSWRLGDGRTTTPLCFPPPMVNSRFLVQPLSGPKSTMNATHCHTHTHSISALTHAIVDMHSTGDMYLRCARLLLTSKRSVESYGQIDTMSTTRTRKATKEMQTGIYEQAFEQEYIVTTVAHLLASSVAFFRQSFRQTSGDLRPTDRHSFYFSSPCVLPLLLPFTLPSPFLSPLCLPRLTRLPITQRTTDDTLPSSFSSLLLLLLHPSPPSPRPRLPRQQQDSLQKLQYISRRLSDRLTIDSPFLDHTIDGRPHIRSRGCPASTKVGRHLQQRRPEKESQHRYDQALCTIPSRPLNALSTPSECLCRNRSNTSKSRS